MIIAVLSLLGDILTVLNYSRVSGFCQEEGKFSFLMQNLALGFVCSGGFFLTLLC